LNWSNDLDRKIVELYEKYGKEWHLIAKKIPNKNSK
jgi:hypothetical protein